jgi:hypothetical protein
VLAHNWPTTNPWRKPATSLHRPRPPCQPGLRHLPPEN